MIFSPRQRTKNQLKMYKPPTRALFEQAAVSCRGTRPLLSMHRTASLPAAHTGADKGCPTVDALLRACRDLLSYDFRKRVSAEDATKLDAFASLVSWPLCGVAPTAKAGGAKKEGVSAMKVLLSFELEVAAARKRHRAAGTDIDAETGEGSARQVVLAGIENLMTWK